MASESKTMYDAECLGHEILGLVHQFQPTDSRLRDGLMKLALKSATKTKEKETADTTYSRKCIYCYKFFDYGLHSIIEHINKDHCFKLGNPNNIVFGAKLLDTLEEKFQMMQCLYCEKVFPSHELLRTHMRKKEHRSLNPNNKFFDRFYLANYLQPDVPWQNAKLEDRRDNLMDGDLLKAKGFEDQWTGWEDEEKPIFTCLFCNDKRTKLSPDLMEHMEHSHKFNIKSIMLQFGFYDRVKAVNYLRTKIPEDCCPYCDAFFGNAQLLQSHLRSMKHCKLPSPSVWCDGDKYLKPVMENDSLLFELENNMMLTGNVEREYDIIAEDMPTHGDVRETRLDDIIHWQNDEKSKEVAHCLFCDHSYAGFGSAESMIHHMDTYHSFDWYVVMNGLSTKQQTNLVCYIKQKTSEVVCYICGQQEESVFLLDEHRSSSDHTGRPTSIVYSSPTFKSTITSQDNSLFALIEE